MSQSMTFGATQRRVAAFGAGAMIAAIAALGFAIGAHAQTSMSLTNAMTAAGIPDFSSFSNLTVGARGQEVYQLQSFLSEMGFKSAVLPTTYFGSVTKAALVAYQRSVSLPATGYFGPLTRSAISSALAIEATELGIGQTQSSTQASSATSQSNLAQQTPTGAGYWYNNVWYPTSPSNGVSTSNASTATTSATTTSTYGMSTSNWRPY